MGFDLIYWTPMSSSYFLYGSILEKCDFLWKNSYFSGWIWPDWGNTTWTDMAGLGFVGITSHSGADTGFSKGASIQIAVKH